jgi:hypothetical protein
MTVPKKQHVIPELHLKHFADANGRVCTFDAMNGKSWFAAVGETAVESHFYSGELGDGSKDPQIETHLAQIESKAAPVYEGLLRGDIPGQSQGRMDFAHFLGLMVSRTRAMRRMAAEIRGRRLQALMFAAAQSPEAFDAAVRGYEKEIGRRLSLEERERARQAMIDPSEYEFEIPKFETFRALGAADKLATLFFKMEWCLLKARKGFYITSDNPVCRRVHQSTIHPIYGDRGFLNRTAEVTFPLSSSVLLFLSWNSHAIRGATLPPEWVRTANEVRASQSDQYLYAHVHSSALETLAARFRDSRPMITTEGFGPEKYGPITLGE